MLLDINGPGMNGAQLLEALRARFNRRHVVMLIAVLRVRVDGFVLKDGAETELTDASGKMSTGQKSISASLLQRALDISLNRGAGSPHDRLKSRPPDLATCRAGFAQSR